MTPRVVTIELRYRAQADELISARHARLMERLFRLPQPWGLSGSEGVPLPDIGDGLEVQVDLRHWLATALQGYVAYVFRSRAYLRDESEFDDRMVLGFDIAKQDYHQLVYDAFPAYAGAFEAYRGTIVLDEGLAIDDWERAADVGRSSGKDLDGRDGVFRIGPVNFLDRELCRRAFGLTPQEIVGRLADRVEHVSLVANAVFLVVDSAPLGRAALEKLDPRVREHLC